MTNDFIAAIYAWVKAAILKAGWAPISLFLLHQLVARGFDAYALAPALDIPMHFFGGVVIAYFIWVAITIDQAEAIFGPLNLMLQAILALSWVFAAVVLWEFAEWVTDFIGWSTAQLSVDDTMLDMLLGVCGGATFILLASYKKWQQCKSKPIEPYH